VALALHNGNARSDGKTKSAIISRNFEDVVYLNRKYPFDDGWTVLLRHHLTEGDIIKLGQARLDSDRKAIHKDELDCKFGVGISIA